MRKWLPALLPSLVCVLLISASVPDKKGKVKKVLDGDTIVLESGEKVRYLCIDSPEEGEPFHDEAARVNDSLVFGKMVRVEFDRKVKDRYSRHLGYVWLDTLLVNDFLLRRGLVSVYYFKPNDRYLEQFVASAKSARTKKLGIWSLPHSDLDYYVGNKSSYRVHRPDCPQARSIKAKNRAEFDNLFDAADAGFA
ncbi:MAG: thermonuclease family protein, partial [candidate division Zixibacteria bacterium]|nr:thermonuclease family protein [candidate division Zixibacteria bacterium]